MQTQEQVFKLQLYTMLRKWNSVLKVGAVFLSAVGVVKCSGANDVYITDRRNKSSIDTSPFSWQGEY
jgi:hypothetical protein